MSKRPVGKIMYRNKEGQQAEAAVIWPGNFDWSYNVQPHTKTTDGDFPTIKYTDALKRVGEKDGFLNLTFAKGLSLVREEEQQDDGF